MSSSYIMCSEMYKQALPLPPGFEPLTVQRGKFYHMNNINVYLHVNRGGKGGEYS